jgi:hypothetical protein
MLIFAHTSQPLGCLSQYTTTCETITCSPLEAAVKHNANRNIRLLVEFISIMHQSNNQSISQCMCVHVRIYLSVCVYLSLCLSDSVCLSFWLSVRLSDFCLSFWLSVCLSDSDSLLLTLYLFIYIPTYPSNTINYLQTRLLDKRWNI